MLILPNKKIVFLKTDNIVTITCPSLIPGDEKQPETIQFDVLSEFSGKYYRQTLEYPIDQKAEAIADYEAAVKFFS